MGTYILLINIKLTRSSKYLTFFVNSLQRWEYFHALHTIFICSYNKSAWALSSNTYCHIMVKCSAPGYILYYTIRWQSVSVTLFEFLKDLEDVSKLVFCSINILSLIFIYLSFADTIVKCQINTNGQSILMLSPINFIHYIFIASKKFKENG